MRKTHKIHVNDEVMSTAGVPVADFDANEAFYQSDFNLDIVVRDGNGEGSVVRFWEYAPWLNEGDYPEDKYESDFMVAKVLPNTESPTGPRDVLWEEYVEQCDEGTMCVPRDVYSEAVYHIEELGIKDDIARYRDAIDKLTSAANGEFDPRLYAMCELLSEELQDRLISLGVDIYSTPDKTVFADAYKSMVESGLYSNMMDVYSCYDMLKDVYGRYGAELADVAEVSDAEGDKRVEEADDYKDAMREYVDTMDKYIETVGAESFSTPYKTDDVLYDAAYIMSGNLAASMWGLDDKRVASESALRDAAKDVRHWMSNYKKREAEKETLTVSVSATDDYGDDVEKTSDYGLDM